MLLTVALMAAPCLLWVSPPRRFFSWFMYAAMLVLYASAVTLAVNYLLDRKAVRSLFSRGKFLLGRFSGR